MFFVHELSALEYVFFRENVSFKQFSVYLKEFKSLWCHIRGKYRQYLCQVFDTKIRSLWHWPWPLTFVIEKPHFACIYHIIKPIETNTCLLVYHEECKCIAPKQSQKVKTLTFDLLSKNSLFRKIYTNMHIMYSLN